MTGLRLSPLPRQLEVLKLGLGILGIQQHPEDTTPCRMTEVTLHGGVSPEGFGGVERRGKGPSQRHSRGVPTYKKMHPPRTLP